jgi:GDP-D-mannose dehydratase
MPGCTKTAFIIRRGNKACLAEVRLRKGYGVHRLKRSSPLSNTRRIDRLRLHPRERGAHSKVHYGNPTKPVRQSLVGVDRL